MSETTQKRARPRIVASAAGLALLGGGYAAGVYLNPPPEFGETAGSACRNLTHEANVEEVSALVPAAEGYSVHESVMERPTYYSGLCTVEAGNDQALYLSVQFTRHSDFETWSEEVGNDFLPDEGRQRLRTAGGGWSTSEAVAVYVPCTMSNEAGQEKQGGMSVRVRTDNGGDHRADLTALAERAAEEAGSLSGPCDEQTAE